MRNLPPDVDQLEEESETSDGHERDRAGAEAREPRRIASGDSGHALPLSSIPEEPPPIQEGSSTR